MDENLLENVSYYCEKTPYLAGEKKRLTKDQIDFIVESLHTHFANAEHYFDFLRQTANSQKKKGNQDNFIYIYLIIYKKNLYTKKLKRCYSDDIYMEDPEYADENFKDFFHLKKNPDYVKFEEFKKYFKKN